MFTAEELEECDIFPKKITLVGVLKFVIYGTIMSAALIMIYSFYSGRDFTSVLLLENLKYESQSFFLNRIAHYDYNMTKYDNRSKYKVELENINTTFFMQNYVKESMPLIIENAGKKLELSQSEFNQSLKNEKIPVLALQDPEINFYMTGFKYKEVIYDEFLQISQNHERLENYFINNYKINQQLKEKLNLKNKKEFEFIQHLKLKDITYSEGFNEILNAGHMDYEDNLICPLKGSLHILIVTPLDRYTVYPYKKRYGPTNYSAVKFFKPEFGRFPNFSKANRLLITIQNGDCFYVPAFWWYSTTTEDKNHFVYLNYKFYSNSRYVEEILKGIEMEEF